MRPLGEPHDSSTPRRLESTLSTHLADDTTPRQATENIYHENEVSITHEYHTMTIPGAVRHDGDGNSSIDTTYEQVVVRTRNERQSIADENATGALAPVEA